MTFVVGVAVAFGGCGLDRSGLTADMIPDDAGPHPGNGGSGGERGSGGGSGGSILGTGGASGNGGTGGGIIVGGSGGMIGTGGMIVGTGGMIIGTGGKTGTGGMIVGTGGKTGTGGMIVGTGGMIVGTGGMIVGTGGSVDGGTGGMVVGTGGSVDGGTDAGTGGAGMGGSGVGGQPGVGGGPGTGGMGPPPICTPACGPCQRCTANHTCEVDPASTWDLAAVSAAVMPDDPNVQGTTMDWDLPSGEVGGVLPDPFVQLDVLTPLPITEIGHTTPIVDTLLPNWGALMPPTQALLNPADSPIQASDLLAGGKNWLISVYDDDVEPTTIPPAGETICQISGPLTSADFLHGGFTRTNVDSCFSISIKLTCHP